MATLTASPPWSRARGAPPASARWLVQQGLLFPALGWFAAPTVVGQAALAELDGPVILAANHGSHADTTAILWALGTRARRERVLVAAAADTFFRDGWRAFGAQLTADLLPFERQGDCHASLDTAAEALARGRWLLLYPEGTRSRTGQMARFKIGVGLLASRTGATVVPIHLAGFHQVLPPGARWPRRTPTRISLGRPLRFAPGMNPAAITVAVEWAVRSLAMDPTPQTRRHR